MATAFKSPEWQKQVDEMARRPATVPLNQRHYPTAAQLEEVRKIGQHYPIEHMPVTVEFKNGDRKNLERKQAIAACLKGEATVVAIIPEPDSPEYKKAAATHADGLLIRFLVDSGHGHTAGTVAMVSKPSALIYIKARIAELVEGNYAAPVIEQATLDARQERETRFVEV